MTVWSSRLSQLKSCFRVQVSKRVWGVVSATYTFGLDGGWNEKIYGHSYVPLTGRLWWWGSQFRHEISLRHDLDNHTNKGWRHWLAVCKGELLTFKSQLKGENLNKENEITIVSFAQNAQANMHHNGIYRHKSTLWPFQSNFKTLWSGMGRKGNNSKLVNRTTWQGGGKSNAISIENEWLYDTRAVKEIPMRSRFIFSYFIRSELDSGSLDKKCISFK